MWYFFFSRVLQSMLNMTTHLQAKKFMVSVNMGYSYMYQFISLFSNSFTLQFKKVLLHDRKRRVSYPWRVLSAVVGDGVPLPWSWLGVEMGGTRGYHLSWSWKGEYPVLVLGGGYPSQMLGQGYPTSPQPGPGTGVPSWKRTWDQRLG